MTRFGYVMTTYFALLAFACAAIFPVSPKFIWNASASVPIGLYALHPAGALHVTELVVARPPAALAAFLDERYLAKGVPMLKRILALPGQTVCRTGHTITVDGVAMGDALDRDSRGPAAARLARLPRRRRRRSLPDELAVRGFPRRPLLRSASRQHHRRPGRSALDARGRWTVPDHNQPIAIRPRSAGQRPSSPAMLVPTMGRLPKSRCRRRRGIAIPGAPDESTG
jgi:type IV secretory pathway protease TraF